MFILPKQPSLAEKLGAGIGEGLSQSSQLAQQLMMKNFEAQKRKQLIDAIEGGQYESQGTNLTQNTPQDESFISSESPVRQKDPFSKAKAYASAGEHELARTATEEAKLSEKRKMAEEERGFLPKKEYIQHAAKQNVEFLEHIGQLERDMPSTEFSLAMVEESL